MLESPRDVEALTFFLMVLSYMLTTLIDIELYERQWPLGRDALLAVSLTMKRHLYVLCWAEGDIRSDASSSPVCLRPARYIYFSGDM